MERKYNELTIRNARKEDAGQLCTWWNDGAVMAHAGFPNGLGTTVEEVTAKIDEESDETVRRHIILWKDAAIGEMVCRNLGNSTCEIGIKICDANSQNKGLGKIALSLFIDGLFHEFGYRKILLDTNLENKRAQHVYEQIGFRKIRTNIDSWKDQLGNLQSSVDYELTEQDFISYPRECKTNIRKAGTGDLSRIAEIYVFNNRINFFPIFKDESFSFGELQVVPLANDYFKKAEILKNTYVLDDGVIKGFLQMDGTEICKLYVDISFQGKGIGNELMEFAVKELGADHLWALERNSRAIAFYERHGFHLTGQKRFEEDTTEYLVRLER